MGASVPVVAACPHSKRLFYSPTVDVTLYARPANYSGAKVSIQPVSGLVSRHYGRLNPWSASVSRYSKSIIPRNNAAMDCLLVNGKVWITFRVARWWSGKKASHSPRWAIQRRKNLPPGWIVGIRLTESNNAVLDYLLMPTRALVGRMVKFTEKARCRHKASRFETVDALVRSIIARTIKTNRPP